MEELKNLQNKVENFSIEEFEKQLPQNMQFNTAKLVNGNELYWVTEKPFTAEDLEAFQETMANKTSVRKAYVTFKDISSLDFQKDLDNQALVTMRKYDNYNLLPFVQTLATNGLDISGFAKPSDKVDGLYIFGDSEDFSLRATAFYNGNQIAQCNFLQQYDDDTILPQVKLGSGKWEGRPVEYFEAEFEKETENFAVKTLGAQLKEPKDKLNEPENGTEKAVDIIAVEDELNKLKTINEKLTDKIKEVNAILKENPELCAKYVSARDKFRKKHNVEKVNEKPKTFINNTHKNKKKL